MMAGVRQQPDQSNYLAEGQTQTCKPLVRFKKFHVPYGDRTRYTVSSNPTLFS